MTLEALAHQLVMYLITLLGYNIINENNVIRTIYIPVSSVSTHSIDDLVIFRPVCI